MEPSDELIITQLSHVSKLIHHFNKAKHDIYMGDAYHVTRVSNYHITPHSRSRTTLEGRIVYAIAV